MIRQIHLMGTYSRFVIVLTTLTLNERKNLYLQTSSLFLIYKSKYIITSILLLDVNEVTNTPLPLTVQQNFSTIIRTITVWKRSYPNMESLAVVTEKLTMPKSKNRTGQRKRASFAHVFHLLISFYRVFSSSSCFVGSKHCNRYEETYRLFQL